MRIKPCKYKRGLLFTGAKSQTAARIINFSCICRNTVPSGLICARQRSCPGYMHTNGLLGSLDSETNENIPSNQHRHESNCPLLHMDHFGPVLSGPATKCQQMSISSWKCVINGPFGRYSSPLCPTFEITVNKYGRPV